MSLKSRPRRNIVKPVFDYTAVKEEEWALRRALYASLRKTASKDLLNETGARKRKALIKKRNLDPESPTDTNSEPKIRKLMPIRKSARIPASVSSEDDSQKPIERSKLPKNKMAFVRRTQDRLVRIKTRSQRKKDEEPIGHRLRTTRSFVRDSHSSNADEKSDQGKYTIISKKSRGVPEKNIDLNESNTPDARKRFKKENVEKLMLAQRKFASSQPCSPSSLLLRQIATPLSERPKTEDFIKFLCLRGTPALPKELEFLNNPCMPPSPLSSDDDEPQYPVSPFFRRQTTSRPTPLKETPVKTERQISDSSADTISRHSPHFGPRKLSDEQDSNGEVPLVTPRPKFAHSPVAAPQLSISTRKSRSLKRAMNFSSKEEDMLIEDSQTAFVRVCSPKSVRNQSPGQKMSPQNTSSTPRKSLSPSKKAPSLPKKAGVSPKPIHSSNRHSQSEPPKASSSPKTSLSSRKKTQTTNNVKSSPTNEVLREPFTDNVPLFITTNASSPCRTVSFEKRRVRKKLLAADMFQNDAPNPTHTGGNGSVEGVSDQQVDNIDVICLYQDSSSDSNDNERGKKTGKEIEHGRKKSGKERLHKSRNLEKLDSVDVSSIRSVKDFKGKLVVSLSSGEQDCSTPNEEMVTTAFKDKKHSNKHKTSIHSVLERAIPQGQVLKPMEQEFKDPVKFLKKIEPTVSKTGLCVVTPPAGWRSSTVINEDIRFNTKMQHIHRLRYRFGPSSRKLSLMKKYLEEMSVVMENIPQIGSCEIDLVKVSEAMRLFGGLQQVTNARKWLKLADFLRIPKNAHGRVNRLQDIYLKYVLPYDSLTEEKKKRLEKEFDEELEEKIIDLSVEEVELKGKSTSVAQFHRIACSAQEMYADKNDTTSTLEGKFWTLVDRSDRHVASLIGEIDASNCGPAFQVSKTKSGWNLSQLPLSSGSALHGLGSLPGITTPTIKFGSVFSTSGWTKKEESLHLVEYLHAGASRIWYGIPPSHEQAFLACLKKKMESDGCNSGTINSKYLISPKEVLNEGIPVTRVVQNERQFIFIVPNVYYCVVNTGYCCTESVNFAPMTWLLSQTESMLFPIDKLLIYMVKEETEKAKISDFADIFLSKFQELRRHSLEMITALREAGIQSGESLEILANIQVPKQRKNVVDWQNCSVCKKPCYLILVNFGSSSRVLCPTHALKEASLHKSSLGDMEYFTQFSEAEWDKLEDKLKRKIEDNESPNDDYVI